MCINIKPPRLLHVSACTCTCTDVYVHEFRIFFSHVLVHVLNITNYKFVFLGFLGKFTGSVADWRSYYDDKEPHLAPLPSPWNGKLNEFQKLIVLRCLRPDKVRKLIICISIFSLHFNTFNVHV